MESLVASRCTTLATCAKLSGELPALPEEPRGKLMDVKGSPWIILLILVKLLCIRSECLQGPTERKTQAPGFKGCTGWTVTQSANVRGNFSLCRSIFLRALVPEFPKFWVVWFYPCFSFIPIFSFSFFKTNDFTKPKVYQEQKYMWHCNRGVCVVPKG